MKWLGPTQKDMMDVKKQEIEVNREEKSVLSLSFMKPYTNDSGDYTCTAIYDNSEKLKALVSVIFYRDITWDDCPQAQALVLGQEGYIKCKVTGNPTPNVEWYKNGKPLSEDRYKSNSEGIRIARVEEIDKGLYKIRATVKQTGALGQRNITVDIYVPPMIRDLPDTTEALEGESVILHCSADGYPSPDYSWLNREYKNMSKEPGYDVDKDKGTLTILKVEKEDRGKYTCVAKNPAGEDRKMTTLMVISKPNIVMLENVTVQVSKTAVLECHVTGDPVPEITIRKEGAVIQNDERRKVETYKEGENIITKMTIYATRRSDDGLYYCKAFNRGGYAERVGHITVEFPPDLSVTTLTNVKTWKDNPVNLTCLADAIPNATISWWLRNNEIRKQNNSAFYTILSTVAISKLLVKPSLTLPGGRDVYGTYKCKAENMYGTDEIDIVLKEASIPGPIQKILFDKITATTIVFSIVSPIEDGEMPIKTYLMEYKEDQNTRNDVYYKEWSEGLSYVVENLKPRTSYLFRFSAKNAVGIGAWSTWLSKKMPKESVPDKPLLIQSGGNMSFYSLHYEIRCIIPADNGKHILFFELKYFKVRRNVNSWIRDDEIKKTEINYPEWRSCRFNIRGLEPNSYYKVELRAKNEIGYSESSKIVFNTGTGNDMDEKEYTKQARISTTTIIIIVILLILLICVLLDLVGYFRYHWGVLYYFRSMCKKPVKKKNTSATKNTDFKK
ncbi:fasciclin-2-like [Tachypleus tridentatus]|uniref:fasciclin-2-like n=1 Tax=Tachypleus tridentatus TaxID=6853 RepID=UPI003FD5ADDF